MGAFTDWIRDVFGESTPPPRTLQLPRHVPSTPTLQPSVFMPSLRSDTFHTVNDNLRRANNILGTQPGTRQAMVWPPRHEWNTQLREARQLRESSMNMILGDISRQMPHLKQFTDRIQYAPERFNAADSRAHTGGWSDDPANPPFSHLNDTAFSDTANLNRTIRHEVWHEIQRAHPQVYRGSQTLREFDAHLRDLENRHAFRIGNQETFVSLTQAYNNLHAARQEPFWNQLQQVQRDNFTERFERQRQDVCRELADTPFRTTPDYSRICGPPFDPFQQHVNRLFGR